MLAVMMCHNIILSPWLMWYGSSKLMKLLISKVKKTTKFEFYRFCNAMLISGDQVKMTFYVAWRLFNDLDLLFSFFTSRFCFFDKKIQSFVFYFISQNELNFSWHSMLKNVSYDTSDPCHTKTKTFMLINFKC